MRAARICAAALGAQLHKFFDFSDFQTGFLQAFNDVQRFDFIVAEFSDAGTTHQMRKQSFVVIVSQRRNRHVDLFGNLTDGVHGYHAPNDKKFKNNLDLKLSLSITITIS